jgi:hypothetical protein
MAKPQSEVQRPGLENAAAEVVARLGVVGFLIANAAAAELQAADGFDKSIISEQIGACRELLDRALRGER